MAGRRRKRVAWIIDQGKGRDATATLPGLTQRKGVARELQKTLA